MNDELREAIEAERGAWHEFYADRATADELEAACAATDAAVAALRAKADAADRVRGLCADALDRAYASDADVLVSDVLEALDGGQS